MAICPTCTGTRITGPPPELCSTCNGSGAERGTIANGLRDLERELLRWTSMPTLTFAQSSRLADICVVIVDGHVRPGTGRLAALTGIRALMDCGRRETAREFCDKHSSLLTDHDRLLLKTEFFRSTQGARVLEAVRG
jgi:hypothetical protein